MKIKDSFEKTRIKLMRALNKKVYLDVAGVILEKEGKILLVQEGSEIIPEMEGKWNFPMGRIARGERPFKCAMRESREETGLVIIIESRLNLDSQVRPHRQEDVYSINIGVLHMFARLFEAKATKGELKISSDLLDAKWFSLEEIGRLKEKGELIDSSMVSAIADYNEMIFKRRTKAILKEIRKKQ